MLKRANINWNAKQLVKMISKGSICFDNAVQRGYVWDNKRNSLLIHSMIEGYPIPAFYAVRNENYDFLDGKQRSNAIFTFMKDMFALSDVPPVETEDGEELDINGLKYSELPEDIQDAIASYSLTIYYFEDISEDQIIEMFYRLNNGKPLTAIELTRVKAKSIDTIRELGNHELLKTILTDKAINRYTNEDIVIKTWIMLNVPNPCFNTKVLRPITEEADFTAEDVEIINKIYDTIYSCYNKISEDNSEKINSKVAKRIVTRTHMITIVPLVKKCITDGIQEEKLIGFLKNFFNGTKKATCNNEYNNNSTAGSGHEKAIATRLQIIDTAWEKYLGEN